jgi:hypothetical protein
LTMAEGGSGTWWGPAADWGRALTKFC